MIASANARSGPGPGLLLLIALLTLLTGCAKPALENGHPAKPDGLFALAETADLAYSESRWLDAARAYQQLTERVPQDPYSWFRLGNVYARQGLFEEAATAYQASIQRSPVQPKPWYNLATTHLLSAQHALRQSYKTLRSGDPARQLIAQQLKLLDAVVYQRFDDGPEP